MKPPDERLSRLVAARGETPGIYNQNENNCRDHSAEALDRQQPRLDRQHRPLAKDSKIASVLRVFLQRGDTGLNCFEATWAAHDFVLRSSVSVLTRHHGVEFAKTRERVPGHAGSVADCVRYRLTPAGEAQARKLLGAV